MKIRFGFLAAMFGSLLLAGSAADATPMLVGTTTDPTGIDNLLVDGTDYNVTFSTTTLNSFSESSTLSSDAVSSLISALNGLSVTALGNDAASGRYFIDVDNSLSSFEGPFCISNAQNRQCAGSWVDAEGVGWPGLGSLNNGNDYLLAADFSVASAAVPEPSSIAVILAGLGLIGGALYLRRRKGRVV